MIRTDGLLKAAATAVRASRQGDDDGRAAVRMIAAGFAATPLDMLLTPWERRIRNEAAQPARVVLVCGPPRSGTTITAQILSQHLDVSFPTNLMNAFPRSPLAAGRLFRVRPTGDVGSSSFYGRDKRWSGRSDILKVWDRHLSGDRSQAAREVTDATGLGSFFGALATEWARPVVAKNNSLNSIAATVAEALPSAAFLCLQREPLFLAQSLLEARRVIHADDSLPYGIHHPDRVSDVYEDIANQVGFHERLARDQTARLGAERFRLVRYEEFCADPRATLRWAAAHLGIEPPSRPPAALTASNRRRLPPEELRRLEKALSEAGI